MSYISDAEHIRNLPDVYDVGGEGIKVLIGPENVAEELKDSSVVLASYDMGDDTKGLIGVVGPTQDGLFLRGRKAWAHSQGAVRTPRRRRRPAERPGQQTHYKGRYE